MQKPHPSLRTPAALNNGTPALNGAASVTVVPESAPLPNGVHSRFKTHTGRSRDPAGALPDSSAAISSSCLSDVSRSKSMRNSRGSEDTTSPRRSMKDALQDHEEDSVTQSSSSGSRRRSFWQWIPAVGMPTMGSTMELRPLNFQDLAYDRYGSGKKWHELHVSEQVDLIKDALVPRQFTIDPACDYMKYWDIVIMFSLLFTAVVTPYDIAFTNLQGSDILYASNRIVDGIFIKDMIMQFFLKVKKTTKQGTVWMRDRKDIARLYLRTWFIIDLLSIVPYDELTNVLSQSESAHPGLEKLKAMRLLRVFRLFKLVRIIKASRVVKRWENRVGIAYQNIHIMKLTSLILASCHWMACVWGFFGLLDGSNLVCRQALEASNPEDLRLLELDQEYWITEVVDGNPYSPAHWVGQSWVVNFAAGRAAGNPLNPCDSTILYFASLYWAVMTITSIGYGDVLPVTVAEYVVCLLLMLLSSIMWAYIIGAACAVLANTDPEETDFEQRMDAFNAMAGDEELARDIRCRGREYIREERFHQHYIRNQASLRSLGNDLRGAISQHIAAHYLDNIWFFKPVNRSIREDLANRFKPHFYERRELVLQFGQLCVVERGAVGRLGRILVPWNYWGDDMLLRNSYLRVKVHAIALSFTEIVTLSRDDLIEVLADYPKDLKWFRRCAALIALARAIRVYSDEKRELLLTGGHEEDMPDFGAWIETVNYEGSQRGNQGRGADLAAAAPIGEQPLTSDERLQRILALAERRESRSDASEAIRKLQPQLDSIQQQLAAMQALQARLRFDASPEPHPKQHFAEAPQHGVAFDSAEEASPLLAEPPKQKVDASMRLFQHDKGGIDFDSDQFPLEYELASGPPPQPRLSAPPGASESASARSRASSEGTGDTPVLPVPASYEHLSADRLRF